MPRDGSGNYSLPQAAYITGTVIDASAMNSNLADIATALTGSVPRDGEAAPTANVPMGGFKFTGLGAATAAGQALTYGTALNVTSLVTSSGASGFGQGTIPPIGTYQTVYLNGSASGGYIVLQASGVQVARVQADTSALNLWGDGASVVTTLGTVGTERARYDLLGGYILGGAVPATASGGGTTVSTINAASAAVSDFTIAGTRIGTLLATTGEYRLSAVANVPVNIYTNNTLRATFNAAGGQTFTGDTTAMGVAISRSKSATTSRASTTTRTDDPDLVAPLAVGRYSVELAIPFWGTTTGTQGFSYGLAFSGTSSNSFEFSSGVDNAIATNDTVTRAIGGSSTFATILTGTGPAGADFRRISAELTVSVAGNLSFQWAQASANANQTNLGAGAWMNCVKVG